MKPVKRRQRFKPQRRQVHPQTGGRAREGERERESTLAFIKRKVATKKSMALKAMGEWEQEWLKLERDEFKESFSSG